MPTEVSYYRLQFKTNGDNNASLRIPDAAVSVPAASIKSAMQEVISKECEVKIDTNVEKFASIRGAQLINTSTVVYEV